MTPRRRRPSELAAVLALALAAFVPAACGGGDGKPQDGEGTPPAADGPAAEETGLDPAEGDGAAGTEAEGEDAEDTEAADGEQDAGEAGEAGPTPSDYARRAIPRPLLRLYRQTGANLLIDWWVIAAVDQIDLKSGNPAIPARERIPGIGYSLAAAGAPHDNHAALAARAGGAYADRALKLAGRYVDTVKEQRRDGGSEEGEKEGEEEGEGDGEGDASGADEGAGP